MKTDKSFNWRSAGAGALLLASTLAGNAWADRVRPGGGYHGGYRGSSHIGVVIGGPFWNPWYFPSPYYYPQYPPVVIERAPPIYIEQADPLPAAQESPGNYWYYCGASKAYYPYVNECPSGWQRVSPRPPNQP